MGTVFDYLNWRGDLLINNDKMNSIDSLILSLISYLDYNNVAPSYLSNDVKPLKECVTDLFNITSKDKMNLGVIVPSGLKDLTIKVAKTDRFKNILISNYINYINEEESCQFSAMCFHTSENDIYVSFRGTDDTLIGWQENLDMICKFPVKAQELARKYLDDIHNLYPSASLFVIGHSKGGNLASFATIYASQSTKEKIVRCYNFDGPGMVKEFVDNELFNQIKNKIYLYVTKDDVVGTLLDSFYGHIRIVDSNARGLNQHNGLTWIVDGKSFKTVKSISKSSTKFEESVKEMLAKLDDDSKKDLAREVYNLVIDLNTKTLTDLQKNRSLFKMMKVFKDVSFKNRKIFIDLLLNFLRYNKI